ncbi:hypothetical protein CLV76_12728 [Marivita geojedonensis]|nr:hypothetical protein CLV76_12728 [Marivita geojedonensis]
MIDLPTPFQPDPPTPSNLGPNPLPTPVPTPVFHYPHTPKGLRIPLGGAAHPIPSRIPFGAASAREAEFNNLVFRNDP